VIRGRDIVRLPVITRDTGTKVGQVEDLVVNRQGTRVLGLVVGEKKPLGSTRVVAWSAVLVAGLDAVIIDTEKSVTKASRVPEIKEVLERGFVLQDSRVETTAGRNLGKIENFFFYGDSGMVGGYELIGGTNDQQPSGRAFMPTPPSFQAGKDVTFVDPSAAETIEDLASALKSHSRLS
jgi:uncharacterized protein YrrD